MRSAETPSAIGYINTIDASRSGNFKPNDNLMIVDFERAEIQHRQPLQPITTNQRRKRKRSSNKLEGSANNDYEGEIGVILQCFRRFG
jgi:hypothetical protein